MALPYKKYISAAPCDKDENCPGFGPNHLTHLQEDVDFADAVRKVQELDPQAVEEMTPAEVVDLIEKQKNTGYVSPPGETLDDAVQPSGDLSQIEDASEPMVLEIKEQPSAEEQKEKDSFLQQFAQFQQVMGPKKPVTNPNKDRRLSGKARRKQRKAENKES